MPGESGDITDDAILGGRLRLLQPKRGHRFGHDAILLAAAVPAQSGQRVVEFGAGVGAASLALLARVPGIDATLLEIDAELCDLARRNIARNGLSASARAVALDVTASMQDFSAAGLTSGSCDHVFMNPPFNDTSHQASPDPRRRLAHAGRAKDLARCIENAQKILKEEGTVTAIWRADGLDDVTDALRPHFGAMSAITIYPAPNRPAIRVIVSGIKGSSAPARILPALTLNDDHRRPTTEAETILRHGGTWPPQPPS